MKRGTTLYEPLFIPLAVGFLIYLFLVDIFVVHVVKERCVQEYGVTCAEQRDKESAPDWLDQLDPTAEYDGNDALLDEPQGEGE